MGGGVFVPGGGGGGGGGVGVGPHWSVCAFAPADWDLKKRAHTAGRVVACVLTTGGGGGGEGGAGVPLEALWSHGIVISALNPNKRD